MQPVIDLLNQWGAGFTSFAWSMLLQSTVLIGLLGVLDFTIGRRLRASVRYAIWMLLLIKLLLPVSFSLPTGLLRIQASNRIENRISESVPAIEQIREPHLSFESADLHTEDLRSTPPIENSVTPTTLQATLGIQISLPAILFVAWFAGVLGLVMLTITQSQRMSVLAAGGSRPPANLSSNFDKCLFELRIKTGVRLRVVSQNIDPSICGLFAPIILLPSSLPETLDAQQHRAVFLHELMHLKRRDLVVNFVQTLVQIGYFYNPLLWLANRHIRKIREEAVDEAVLVVMGNDADRYPATLVNVARLVLADRNSLFGTIGIMESQSLLGIRVKRMLSRPFPRSSQVGFRGCAGVVLLGFLLLPMTHAEKDQPMNASSDLKEAWAPTSKLVNHDDAKTHIPNIAVGLKLKGQITTKYFNIIHGALSESLTYHFTIDRIGETWRIELIDDVVAGKRASADVREIAYDGRDCYTMSHIPDTMLEKRKLIDGIKPPSQQGRVSSAQANAGFPVEADTLFKFLWLAFCSKPFLHQFDSNAAPSLSLDLFRTNSARARYTLLDFVGLPSDYQEIVPGVVMTIIEGQQSPVAVPCPPPFDTEYTSMHYVAETITNVSDALFASRFRAEYYQPFERSGSSASNYLTANFEGKVLTVDSITNTEIRPEVNGDTILTDHRFRNIRYIANKPGHSNWLDRASQTLDLELSSKNGAPIYQRSNRTGKPSERRED